jgi:short-subunit dehydrogenase
VATECKELGAANVHVIVTDTREAQQVQHLADEAVNLLGRIDIWVNNAGVLAVGALEDIPQDVNEDVIRTNLLGYIHGAQSVLPYFKHQRHGFLINNISVGGWFPTPYMAAYSASKFGLRGFFEALKGEINQYPHIHICDLYPGFLDTPGVQHAANYTGKNLRPAPPVYDPRLVARTIIKLIEHPQSKKTVGASSTFLRLAYSLFPRLSRNITANTVRSYLKNAVPIENTSGNILQSVEYGNGIDGGWRTNGIQPSPKTKSYFVLAGIAVGILAMMKR